MTADKPIATPAPAADRAGGQPKPSAPPARVTAETAPYVTRPTRWTIFMRTFIPWQVWRFIRINMKMIGIIFRSRR